MAAPRRRRAAAALALSVVLATLTACGGSESGGKGTDLRWFVAIQPGGSIQEIAKRCSEQSGGEYSIQLELLPTDADPQREQLVRRLGAEDSTIDLIGMDVIWTAEFANAGWLQEYPANLRDQVTENVFSSVVDTASFEGRLYGAPFNSNTQLLFYRKDKVGQPPQTWSEMIREAERLDTTIEVQAARYEGLTVWANAMISSAGGKVIEGPEEVSLEEGPTTEALATIGELANSPAASNGIDTSDEDSARLAFEAETAYFMINYPFAFGSAKENAPKVFENIGVAKYPAVSEGQPANPPLGGFNIGVSKFSENSELAFEAAACIGSAQSQLIATELDGLPPTRANLYGDKVVRDAYPGFADVIKQSIEAAEPRPLTPAYTDLSLAIQRSLHPTGEIDPDDPSEAYDSLREAAEDAVLREGLL